MGKDYIAPSGGTTCGLYAKCGYIKDLAEACEQLYLDKVDLLKRQQNLLLGMSKLSTEWLELVESIKA